MKKILFFLLSFLTAFYCMADTLPERKKAVIGVLAFRSKAQTLEEWSPLASYLQKQIPSYTFIIRPLSYHEFNDAVEHGELEFAFTNPEHYVYLSVRNNATRIATLIRANVEGKPVKEFGGVIIALASRHDLSKLADLKGKKIAAVDKLSLGGYLAQSALLKQEGIGTSCDVSMHFTDMPHDKVVMAVAKGEVDAGFVRTSVLEKMVGEGKIKRSDFKIIHPQQDSEFPQLHSTPLYPEWPFATFKGTDPFLANKVAVALLSLPPNSEAARRAGYYGWSIPSPYEKVRSLMEELRVEPFDTVATFTFRDVIHKYAVVVIVILILISMLLAFLMLRMRNLASGLKVKSEALEEQISIAETARLQLNRAASVFHNSGEGIVITDAQKRIIDVNEAFTELTGYSKAEVMGKKPIILRSGHHDLSFYRALDEALAKDGSWRGEIWDRKKNGEEYAGFLRIDSVRDSDGKTESFIGIMSDITESIKQQDQLHHMANYDPLTNLPNRRLFMNLAEQMLLFAKRKNTKAVIAFLDLDGFKEVNDRYGHGIGDRVLKKIARRLEEQMRKSDSIARMGGDEFVILLADVHTTEDAQILLSRMLQVIKEPIEMDGLSISVGASIGATFFPDDDSEIDMLIRHADTAMYRAKETGRNRITYYDPQERK